MPKDIMPTLEELVATVRADDNIGFCLACGAECGGCEPDTTSGPCDICGEKRVYGAEQLLIMSQG